MAAGLGVPAGMLAFYAGNRVADTVGDSLKKQEKDRELAQVKKRFDELLKMSSDGTFDKYAEDEESMLGRIASGATKQLASTVAKPFLWAGRQAVSGVGEGMQEGWDYVKKQPWAGLAGGLGLAWALTSGGLAGKAMYDFTRGSQEKRLLDEALRKRREQVSKRHLPAVRISEPEEDEYAG